MKNKNNIKILSVLMSLVLLFGTITPLGVKASSENPYTNGLKNFFDAGSHSQLLDKSFAIYMEYAEELRTRCEVAVAMEILGFIYGENSEPGKEQYKQALVNIIRTYENENAASLTQQNMLDDTKKLKDYLHDVANIGLSWLDASDKCVIPEDISLAVSVVNQLSSETEDWTKGAGTLKTVLQLYEKHDLFLRTLETNANGELKEAARELRQEQSSVVKAHLNAYADIEKKSTENFANLFVSEIWAEDWINYLESYSKIKIPKLTYYQVFQGAALGVDIGKLMGNLFVGAEDVITYVVEIKAAHDISLILEDQLKYIKDTFQKDNSKVTETDTQNYITYGNYLISNRIRGQYCMSAIYLQCPSLRSLLGKNAAKNAKSLYNNLTNNLLNVKKKLNEICSTTIITQVKTEVEADTIRYYEYFTPVGFCVISKDEKYGLIDYSGNIILPIKYDSIEFRETAPNGKERKLFAYDSNYQGYWIEQDGSLTPGFAGGWGFENGAEIYWWKKPVMYDTFNGKVPYSYEKYASYHHGANELGTITSGTADVIPVQQIDGSTQTTVGGTTTYSVEKVSEKYALLNLKTETLITDFIFDDYGLCGFVEGILAVSQGDKWGYINENGQMITDFIYDSSNITQWGNKQMYSSLNNHIIVRKGDLWGLIDSRGNTVADVTYDDISQVNSEGLFWAKKGGKWSLYKIDN